MKYYYINEGFTDMLKGEQGEQGIKGIKGHAGDTGLRGLDGPIGIKGSDGPQGPQGIPGFKGDTGEQGEKGLPGERGDVGPKGIIGPIGDKGPRGYKGIRGETGETGKQGEKGAKGLEGRVGDSGSQYSNIGINMGDSCIIKKAEDYYFAGSFYDKGIADPYCPANYGIRGIETLGWSNRIKNYKVRITYDWMGRGSWTTTTDGYKGYQMQRKYNIHCCPVVAQNNGTMFNEKSDNLDDYKKYSSIRKYPFHEP